MAIDVVRGSAVTPRPLPYPPPWQDARTLAEHICCSEGTIDNWVREGLLPPPRLIRGKRMWRWSEVDQYLAEGGSDMQSSPDALARSIRDATRRAAQSR